VKSVARYMFLIFVLGSLCGRVQGDGKFFVEKVPPNIPYQRAFLLFYEGSETLVLQSKYEFLQFDDIDTLGWIVPVPSVPEIASADADVAWECFYKTSFAAQPELMRISRKVCFIALIFFLVSLGFLLLLLVEYPILNIIKLSKAAWRRRFWICLITTFFAFILVQLTMPSLSFGVNVEIVKAEKVGIYDVKVIRSQSAEAILDWLRDNGFGFSEADKQVFEEYISREWCFVVAKIEPEPEIEKNKIVSEGMVAPLILKFETETAVYPLVLTSTVGAETEILLYTLSENKLSCGGRLTLRNARKKQSTYLILNLLLTAEPQERAKELFADIPEYMYFCKFKKKLKPEDMKKDLEFEFASDNEPYKEKKIVW
jgi:hypothetical protein